MHQTERVIDIKVINGQTDMLGQVRFSNELTVFAEAVASFNEIALEKARDALLVAAGPEVLVDAAGVAGNFQRMVRIADAMGIPVDQPTENEISNQVRLDLDLFRFKSAENSASAL